MAGMDHTPQPGSSTQAMLTTPMAPPHDYRPQGRSQHPSPQENHLGKQAGEGEAAEGAGRKQQQQQEEEEVQEEIEWQQEQQNGGGEQGGKEEEMIFSCEEYWEVMSRNLLATVSEELGKGQEEWQRLCRKEQQCLGRLQELHKNAHDMNVSFHSQLDNLHSTVLGLVSSFKK